MIPKSQNTNTIHLKIRSSILVIDHLIIFTVLPSIHFNSQLLLRAIEIKDVATDWVLSPEFISLQTLGAQELPEKTLYIGLILAKRFG